MWEVCKSITRWYWDTSYCSLDLTCPQNSTHRSEKWFRTNWVISNLPIMNQWWSFCNLHWKKIVLGYIILPSARVPCAMKCVSARQCVNLYFKVPQSTCRHWTSFFGFFQKHDIDHYTKSYRIYHPKQNQKLYQTNKSGWFDNISKHRSLFQFLDMRPNILPCVWYINSKLAIYTNI